MSHGLLNPKYRFLDQKVCPLFHSKTDTRTDRVTTEGSLSRSQDFFLQLIIKDQPNNNEIFIPH